MDFVSRMHRALPMVVAFLAFSSASGASYYVLDGIPHMVNEVAYLFQARYFSEGKLYLDGGVPEAQDYFLIYDDGVKRYSKSPPGWPLILAFGVLAGLPWIVNPILHGLNILLIYRIGSTLYDKKTGLLASILGLLSPFMLFMGANQLSHTSTLFFFLLLTLSGLKYQETGFLRFGLLSGLSWGMMTATRVGDGAVAGTAAWIALYVFGTGSASRHRPSVNALGYCLFAFAIPIALLLAYNNALTDSPFISPDKAYIVLNYPETPDCDNPGFGKDRGCLFGGHWNPGGESQGHTLLTAVLNWAQNLKLLNEQLFGWPLTSFTFIFLLFFLEKHTRKDLQLLYITLLFIFSCGFFYSSDVSYGARYYYTVVGFLLLLTARGIRETINSINESALIRKTRRTFAGIFGRPEDMLAYYAVCVILLLFFIYSFYSTWPSLVSFYGDNYQTLSSKVDATVYNTLGGLSLRNALVIVPDMKWGSGFLLNDPSLGKETLFVREGAFNESRNKLELLYAGRDCFVYQQTAEEYKLMRCEEINF